MKLPIFSASLLEWYADNARHLPWRGSSDPYRVWVSEVILQQTRVAQGYDYFLRFMQRFPTVEALADATEDEVLAQWQGLGYYSRARNLHAAARQISQLGSFPDTYEGIRALRGVGDYTAAAVASLAFGLPCAVVDGNVFRVLSRYFGIDAPIDSTQGRRLFFALAQEMLVPERPADYNQAIMDFGALQCTPRAPRCDSCPLADTCQALHDGRVGQLPVRCHRAQVRQRYFTYLCVCCGGRILLQRRGEGDIWQGLWQPPMQETPQPMSLAEVEAWGGRYGSLTCLRTAVVHQLTHQRLQADFYLLRATSRPPFEGTWVPESQLADYAVPRLVEELLKLVLSQVED